MPTSSKPETSAIHRVLIDSGADPKLIHPAIEEIRHLSGQNVITAIGAQITELRSDVQTQIIELRSEMQAQIDDLRTEMQTQFTALRTEMNTLNKFIWTLVSLLAIPMLGLLYKTSRRDANRFWPGQNKAKLLPYRNNHVPASEPWPPENEQPALRQARLNGPGWRHVLSHCAVSNP